MPVKIIYAFRFFFWGRLGLGPIFGWAGGGLFQFLSSGVEFGFSLEVGVADLVGRGGEGFETVHGLAQIFTGLSLIGGQLPFAHDPAGSKECGQPQHSDSNPAIPWRSWGG